jgi:hypothetical protein
MSDVTAEQAADLDPPSEDEVPAAAGGLDAVEEQLIAQLAGRARAGGLASTGEGGLLAELPSGWSSSHPAATPAARRLDHQPAPTRAAGVLRPGPTIADVALQRRTHVPLGLAGWRGDGRF